jgi:DNA processing protein
MSHPTWTLAPGTPAWPHGLPDLDVRAPSQLHGVGNRDAVAALAPDDAVTIVGSRRASPYGRQVGKAIARDLARAGFIVVSGMAIGIDSCAHEGALEAGGTTIAVLAGGPDIPYPPSKRRLYNEILNAGGAIVSEWPPGQRPHRKDFRERNRIMAAMSVMSIVVEAAEPSGSRATADDAANLGRDVGAVPGPVTSRLSAGTNSLLFDGAKMVRDAQDVLDHLIGAGAVRIRGVGPELEPELSAILEVVEAGHVTTDAIMAAHDGAPQDVAVALVRLELMGYVEVDPLGRHSRTALARPVDT